MSNLSGATLGAHHILEQIGSGGMSTVYIAYQPGLERLVALKVLPEAFTQHPKIMERFAQEARIIARLEHPSIIPIYDFVNEKGRAYLTMRYVQAGTVKEILRKGPISLAGASKILDDIASALDYAHERGVIHRDVKPANILVDKDGRAYLTDFGIAKLVEGTMDLTGTATLGTPAYMSPEQTLNQPITSRTDVYSLGISLFEMITGHLPYDADSPMATALMHVNTPIPSPRQFNPKLPESLESVFQKVLAKEPQDRYATAGEFAKAFAAVAEYISVGVNGGSPARPLSEVAADAAAAKHSEEITGQVLDQIRRRRSSERRRRILQITPWALGAIVILGLALGLTRALADAAQARISAEQTSTAIVTIQGELALVQTEAASGNADAEATQRALESKLATQGIQLSATRPPPTNTRTPVPSETFTPTPTSTPRPPTSTAIPVATLTPTVGFALGVVPTAVPDQAGVVRGQVIYRGEPVANAIVTLRQATTGQVYGTQPTDGNGQFIFPGVPPGTLVINATADGGLTSMFYGGYQIGDACDLFIGRANFFRTFNISRKDDANLLLCMVRVGGFDITAPAAGSTFPGLIISWTPIEGVINYDLNVQDITDPRLPPFSEDHLAQASFDYTQKLGGDPTISGHCYLIRVIAYGGAGPIATTTTQACRQ
jgi:serine/threonine protein kinase